jgi:hypothetical protein
VGTRQHADLDGDRADLVDAAAVHADALVEDELADGLLLDEAEQALADARLARAASSRRPGPGLPGGWRGWRPRSRPRGSRCGREVFGELGQQMRRSSRRRQAAMRGLDLDPEEPGDVAELVGLEVRVALAGDHERVEVAAR